MLPAGMWWAGAAEQVGGGPVCSVQGRAALGGQQASAVPDTQGGQARGPGDGFSCVLAVGAAAAGLRWVG